MTKLSEHKFIKGKFVTPLNQHLGDYLEENPWYYGRMPEYLWLGLIIKAGERKEQLIKCKMILDYTKELNGDISLPKLSLFLKLNTDKQKSICQYLKQLDILESLKPLSLLLSVENEVILSYLNGQETSTQERIEKLNEIIEELSDHQSHLSTDIRFLIIYTFALSGKLYISSSVNANFFTEYPVTDHSDPKMRLFRSQIRSMEIGLTGSDLDIFDLIYIENFWKRVSLLTDCEVFYVELDTTNDIDMKNFKEAFYQILLYYTRVFQEIKPLDNRMLTLLGIFTFSYKRVVELVDHNLENTIAGRSIIRSLIENYMMTKYLLKEEDKHEDIWTDYQYYGLGQYKLIYERFEENKPIIEDCHVPFEYIDLLVSEFKDKEFTDMDTKYFDKMNIRDKFNSVGEIDLYRYYYDYDSAFEHGLWGAIRESSILKCNAPGHQYHGVPDVENNQKLKSVSSDCVMVIRKHVEVLDKEYESQQN